MARFMLMLLESPEATAALSSGDPEEIQRIIERYRAWREGIAASGREIGGEKLVDGEGRVLHQNGRDVRVLDGPYSETKEVIAGFFSLEAADYDEAVELARTCPHLEYGGTIEVRRVDEIH